MRRTDESMEIKLREAFFSLARERDFQAITIEEICLRAGCSKGTFYYHFKSMQGLLDTIFDQDAVLSAEVLVDVVGLPGSWAKLWRVARAYTDVAHSLGPELSWVPVALVPPDRRQARIDSTDRFVRFVRPLIEEGQRTGELGNPAPADQLCSSFHIIMSGVLYQWYICSGSFNLEERMYRELSNLYLPPANKGPERHREA